MDSPYIRRRQRQLVRTDQLEFHGPGQRHGQHRELHQPQHHRDQYSIGGLSFGDTNTTTAASWILNAGTGGPLTLATTALTPGGPTINVNALGTGANVTINAILAGTQGFMKNGAGLLVLNGANTYTGWFERKSRPLFVLADDEP